jgi:phospholipid N-methyltransferase
MNKPSHLPIINYSAIKIFKIIFKSEISVLEFGSGRSTLWFQNQNIKKLSSVENNEFWYKIISKQIKSSDKINYYFKKEIDVYKSIGQNEKYDLIIVDGIARNICLKYALENNTHENTVIYLDDSDKDTSINPEYKISHRFNLRLSENILRNHSVKTNRIIYSCRNFSPTHLFIKEGIFSFPKSFSKNKKIIKIIP